MAADTPSGEGPGPAREPAEDLGEEFRTLGKNLKSILQTAWESPERKRLQQEMESGMAELGKSLDQAVKEFKDSPAGQRLKEDAHDFQERLRTGEVEQRLRQDLLAVMRRFNEELGKVSRAGKTGDEPPDRTED
jgi:hypothetical protein